MTRYFVAGGAGFIGSHLVRRLLLRPDAEVVVYDNLISGEEWHLDEVRADPRLRFARGDLKDAETLVAELSGAAHVFHFAANADIAKAVTEPSVDFWDGTYLTHCLLEGMRVAGVPRLTYASGSGVYGDRGPALVDESFGPLLPVSTYGASKLACEGLISAYCHMFDMRATAFRFANVVGPRQTHGVVYDFVRKLYADPTALRIFGDGSQSKSYIHVDDVLDALLLFGDDWSGFDVFNVGTDEYVTVREIADMVVEQLGLADVTYEFTGGARGWRGDVPIVRFSTDKIRALGWRNRRSTREALLDSIAAGRVEARPGITSSA